MQPSRIRHHSVIIFLLSFLLFSPDDKSAKAQFSADKIEVRVGKGWSITTPGLRSVYLSVPSRRLDEISSSVNLYLNQSVTLIEQHRHVEYIVGAAPMVLFELGIDFPRVSFEAGVGANYISIREIDGRRLGSNFLFSPTFSAGIEVPWLSNVIGVHYSFRHLSNAGLFEDNDGVNFQYIIFSMTFGSF
ncbi:acyloxyacyl hydrolase [Sphingobacteriales bacterium CHB3]|nr:acyloxyacyl hydrolase [Sphingobacteriales bacterium CHB3]